ncbi:EG45-like domain containing protein [Senna tora]|uniref:EG45-like domain containing protein n=1 Tax=Senna tora TaxID=362788 RepID=A0A834W3X2_9FABA|nr:EG45-like domain containing protein [Senna tora]
MAFFFALSFALVVGHGNKLVRATFYNPPYNPSACFGNSKINGVMIAAAGSDLFKKSVCGKKFSVKCVGKSHACKTNKPIVVTFVDMCPGCGGSNIDLSREAFGSIAHRSAGVIDVEIHPL